MCRNVALGDPQRAEFARATDLRWQRWLWLEMNVRVRLVRCNILPATPALQRWRKFMQEKKTSPEDGCKFSHRRLPEDYTRSVQTCSRGSLAVQHGSDVDILTERRAHARRILRGWVGFSPHVRGRVQVTRLSRLNSVAQNCSEVAVESHMCGKRNKTYMVR